ncbi:hypothetical protein NC653_030953 [Populus alba x Populus x berolinensis]|uniref:Uncharacterized protein n=1 Tax=Populus alba x Populus x berolinensis TaxID=444605 RepID=A0AAD6Q2Q7_9ROSI|nr:hypothetical protein NC653_030953 [Populus alba x Populus x berolinensis]
MAISFGYEYLRIKQSSNGSLDMEACPDVSFKSCDSFIIYGDTLHCSRNLYKFSSFPNPHTLSFEGFPSPTLEQILLRSFNTKDFVRGFLTVGRSSKGQKMVLLLPDFPVDEGLSDHLRQIEAEAISL